MDSLLDMQHVISAVGFKGDGGDKWVWGKDASGLYSVKLAYKWLRTVDNSGEEHFYNKIWNGGAPLKVKVFV